MESDVGNRDSNATPRQLRGNRAYDQPDLGSAHDGHTHDVRWIGGTEAIGRWLETFYDAVEADGLLGPVFGGVVTREHRDHVTAWWAEVMGGPATYTEEHGGYEHMLEQHRGLGIPPSSGSGS